MQLSTPHSIFELSSNFPFAFLSQPAPHHVLALEKRQGRTCAFCMMPQLGTL